jgi:uncharacterized protein YdeI (YjbR/CyaY-like superfamily)
MTAMIEATYFKDAAALHAWLKAHADTREEVLAGLLKGKAAKQPQTRVRRLEKTIAASAEGQRI